MPDHHLKTALLAAIKPEGSTSLELKAALNLPLTMVVRDLVALRDAGLVFERKDGTTHRWTRTNAAAIPESECENQDLINS